MTIAEARVFSAESAARPFDSARRFGFSVTAEGVLACTSRPKFGAGVTVTLFENGQRGYLFIERAGSVIGILDAAACEIERIPPLESGSVSLRAGGQRWLLLRGKTSVAGSVIALHESARAGRH